MSKLGFDEIDALALAGGHYGKIDLACLLCGPHRKTPANRKRKTLSIWRDDPDFASFNCARCGARGFTRDDQASKADPSEYLRRRAEAERRDAADKQSRIRRALGIWSQGEPIAGTLAAQYLTKRGIDIAELPDEMFHVLRWHPRCPWEGSAAPCMIALWTDAITAEPTGIHRTAITVAAEKIDRMSLGVTARCVIRLWPDDAVTQGLVIGEGVETTLAAATNILHRGTMLTPAWACGSAGNMRAFPVLPLIEAITILVDHDKSGEGQFASAICTQRWLKAGRTVTRLVPRIVGTDFNNIILDEGGYGAA